MGLPRTGFGWTVADPSLAGVDEQRLWMPAMVSLVVGGFRRPQTPRFGRYAMVPSGDTRACRVFPDATAEGARYGSQRRIRAGVRPTGSLAAPAAPPRSLKPPSQAQ
jgi:hypothetical protein